MVNRIEGSGGGSSKATAGSTGMPAGWQNPFAPKQSNVLGISAMYPSMGVQQPAPAPQQRQSGGGGGGGGGSYGGGGGGGFAPAPAPVIQPPSEEDYLAGDAGYQTQVSALTSALQRYLADAQAQTANYNSDYDKSLRDLGATVGADNQVTWNWDDPLTASGRGYQNQLNDFAARGMLQSQGYADANNDLARMLGQQYDSMLGNKTNFLADMERQKANYQADNTASAQSARAEALARRASQFGL